MLINQLAKKRFFGRSLKGSSREVYHETILENQGQHRVTPALPVPKHITRPNYVGQPNQQFKDLGVGSILQYSPEEQDGLRKAGKLASQTLLNAVNSVKEGMTTEDIDKIVHDFIVSKEAYPTPIDYLHFPKSVCTSVNDVICHGIPDNRPLISGDYVNIDVTCFIEGWQGDNSAMVQVGDVHPEVKQLIQVTRECLHLAIKECKPGVKFSHIGDVIHSHASKYQYEICEYFTGHGIGRDLHLPPYVYHHPNDENRTMEEGMAFTIEPIIFLKDPPQVAQWRDNWTVIAPGVPSAQWEHTVIIQKEGAEIITRREGEKDPFSDELLN